MLTRFSVKNYRTFKDELILDFTNTRDYQFNTDCILNDCVGKMIIYGRNGTGKTNLGRALQDIWGTLFYPIQIGQLGGDSSFLNADSAEGEANFRYNFAFDGKKVEYCYKKNRERALTFESLQIDGHTVFSYDHVQNCLNKNDLSSIGCETLSDKKFLLGNNDNELAGAFLSWIFNNSAMDGKSLIGQLYKFVREMRVLHLTEEKVRNSYNVFLSEEDSLSRMESFFNAMGVPCSLVVEKTPDGRRELYYEYSNGLVRFEEAASGGARELYKLYTRVFLAVNKTPSFLFLDEFDAYYHYEMSEKLVKYLIENYPHTQIVMTSHNTNLISNAILRPDCYLILSQDGRLTPLCDATNRELREGHNLEKMYISGEFERYE